MMLKLENRKYYFTVEGETEKWYLEWLCNQIQQCSQRRCDVAFDIKIQQSPMDYIKGKNNMTVDKITHICDIESNSDFHQNKFKKILNELRDANKQKRVKYVLGYSNFAFELWLILHKKDCNGLINNRSQYLQFINRAFSENFKNLKIFKHENNFKKCLSKLSLADVKNAVCRAQIIMNNNKESGNRLFQYCGFKYYEDNPSLTIHETIREILKASGV